MRLVALTVFSGAMALIMVAPAALAQSAASALSAPGQAKVGAPPAPATVKPGQGGGAITDPAAPDDLAAASLRAAQAALARAQASGATPPPSNASRCPGGRTFITYFPFGQSDVTASASGVLQQAINFAGAKGSILLFGHNDSAETSDVSAARIAAVSRALTEAGAAGDAVKSTTPLAATARAVPSDGPEPLNRRVEICVLP